MIKPNDHKTESPVTRDDLIEQVRCGKLTPGQAEAEAARLEIGPLAREADPACFNPLDDPWWTLPMASAWVETRSRAAVTEMWDEYRSQCFIWRATEWKEPERIKGVDLNSMPANPLVHELGPLRPATLTLLSRRFPIKEILRDMWREFGRGAARVSGVSTSAIDPIPNDIPEAHWPSLVAVEVAGKDVLRYRDGGSVPIRGYNDIRINSADIIKRFPPPEASQLATPHAGAPTTRRAKSKAVGEDVATLYPPIRPVLRQDTQQIFTEWRARPEHADIPPTEAQDIAYMKSHGITRKPARVLRKGFPSRPRGRGKRPSKTIS